MLYIEKQQPDKELLARIAEVKSSSEWKQVNDDDTKGIRECFDKLPKDVLRQSILKEQHHLCAYCMKRINDSPLHTTIEHWYPLSKDKNSALDYNNMIGVCRGGSDVCIAEGDKRELCCDAYKGDEIITLNPLNESHMKLIKYTSGGKIYTDNGILDEDINKRLRLNGIFNSDGSFKCDTSTGLVKGRKDAYERSQTIIKKLSNKDRLTSASVRKQIEDIKTQEKMEEFAGVVIFFLERKHRNLVSQGK